MKKSLLASAVAAAVLYSGSGFAQLEEVVVTARKRVETVQDTPVAVRAMSTETLQRFDITSLEKVAAMSPEFSVGRSSNGSGAQLTMRGIGSSSTSIGIEQSVAVIVDDVYYGQGRIINEGMFDLARVELLKGPQALFFGKNATAGAIALSTAEPTAETEIIGKLAYELEAEQTTAEIVVSGALSDTVLARLALRGSVMSGGYYDNRAQAVTYNTVDVDGVTVNSWTAEPNASDLPGEDEFMGRLTLVFEPNDDLTVKLKASATRSENENPSWNYQIYNTPTGNSGLNPANPAEQDFVLYQNDIPNFEGGFPLASGTGLFNEYDSEQATISVQYDGLDNFTLTSVTNYQHNQNTWACACDFQSSNNGTWATEDSTWDAFSEEVRLLSDFDSAFNFMVGVLYQKTDRDFEQYVSFGGVEDTTVDPASRFVATSKLGTTDGETLAPFFQGIVDLADNVELTFGARYTRETKESTFIQPVVHPFLQGLWVQGQEIAAEQKFDEWAPEATINWNVSDDVMLFASYKTGYKSGGFSISGLYSTFAGTSPEDDLLFEPETAKGFEFGVKSTTLDNQLRLNATLYNYDYEDLQVDFFNSAVFAFTTLNAGTAQTRGIEVDAEFAPHAIQGLVLRGALNYNDAEYDDFIAPCWSGQTAAQGCDTLVPGTTAAGQDISGESTSMAPQWTASLALDYETYLENGLGLGFSMNAQWIDDHNPSAFANPHAARDSYTTVDASARLIGRDDRWELALLGKNLTDELVINGVVDGPSTGSPGSFADQAGFGGLPRTVALQLTGRF